MPIILEQHDLAPNIVSFVVDAPRVARRAQPGQFLVVRLTEVGERIPLTIADFDRDKGTITIVVQGVGKSTTQMLSMGVGDNILDLLGPLGSAYPISSGKTVVCVAGGLGAAPIFPKAKALHLAGCRLITILGAQTSEMLIYEEELSRISEALYTTTNDGSKGEAGFVTGPLKRLLDSEHAIDEVIAIGPVPMMSAVCELTRSYGVDTVVSLNSIMVDGTGMCGGCRVTVDGKVRFTCVDGPAFDGHLVDFAELSSRQRYYREHENISSHRCKIGLRGESL